MADNLFMKPTGFLKSGAISAMALAIATMAVPIDAMARDNRRGSERSQVHRSGNGGHNMRAQSSRSSRSYRPQRSSRSERASRPDRRSSQRMTRSDRRSSQRVTRADRSGRHDYRTSRSTASSRWSDRSKDRRSYRTSSRDQRSDRQAMRSHRDDRTYRQASRSNYRWSDRNRRSDRSYWVSTDRSHYRYSSRDRRHYSSRDHRRWDRGWRNNSHYDWYNYRSRNHSYFRVGHYYAPYRDYSYSRLSIGFMLGSGFYGSRYWINDPWRYRLPDVYGSYRWIRYYDDVLLVDTYTGEVVDVIYDFFW